MYYRVKKGNVCDFADYKYSEECKFAENISVTEAQEPNKQLYIVITPKEFEREVPDFELVTESAQKPLLDANGDIVLDDNGEPVIETVEIEFQKPIMIEEAYTELEPKFDEDGNHIGDVEVEKYREIQKLRREVYVEEVYSLLIADKGYYICQEGTSITDGTINPNFEAEKAAKERERINKLKCTKRVFTLMLQELGVSYSQLKDLIATNERAQLEWDLCVELERSNPLLDAMASQLGITSEQLDEIFEKSGKEL